MPFIHSNHHGVIRCRDVWLLSIITGLHGTSFVKLQKIQFKKSTAVSPFRDDDLLPRDNTHTLLAAAYWRDYFYVTLHRRRHDSHWEALNPLRGWDVKRAWSARHPFTSSCLFPSVQHNIKKVVCSKLLPRGVCFIFSEQVMISGIFGMSIFSLSFASDVPSSFIRLHPQHWGSQARSVICVLNLAVIVSCCVWTYFVPP